MARPLRIEYPGALYHVISRGSEKKEIFKDNRDRVKYLELLEECCERFGIFLYCYVLMSNHYHLLLETPQGDLSKVMHWLNVCYVSYFNYRHKRSGPLLQGRYKAILVDKELYLLELTRYIHLNPYRAGMVKDPADYRWSTYRAYLGAAKRVKWVDFPSILSRFSNEEVTARRKYLDYVNQGIEEDTMDPMHNLHGQVILGDKAFINSIKAMLDQQTISPEISERKKFVQNLEPEQIISAVEQTLFVDRQYLLFKGNKKNAARKVTLYMIKKYTSLDNQEIALLFGDIHYTTIAKQCRRFEQEMQNSAEVKKIYEKIMRAVKKLKS